MIKLLFCIIFFSIGCKVDKIDFYLPENFNGDVAILYVNNGTKPTIENKRQKIIIPDSGIVFINQKYNEGEINYKYYIKSPQGYKIIDAFVPGIDTVNGKKYIYFERTMGFNFIDQQSKPVNILGHFFYVGKQLDSITAQHRFLFETKIEKILKTRDTN